MLCTQAAFGSIRSTGKERVLEALHDGAIKYRRYNKLAAEKELLAYPIARIIVSCIDNNYLTKRYVLAVAKSSYEQIKELKSAVLLKELAADFGISIIFDDMMNYQISHISGASGTIYTCPACATMATNGNCPGKAPMCKKIEHPLVYYRRKIWIGNKKQAKKVAP